jgi:hypothetical protein
MTTPDDAQGMEDQNEIQDQSEARGEGRDQDLGPTPGEGQDRDPGRAQDQAEAGPGKGLGHDGTSGSDSASGHDRTSSLDRASGHDRTSDLDRASGLEGLLGLDRSFDSDGSLDLDSPEGAGRTSEEEALRTLLRDAVQSIEASPDALDHLRRAIPARRQHRRQALAGAAAAVLLVGMAVPALIHVADTSSRTGAAPPNVASSHAASPGEDGHTNYWAGGPTAGQGAPTATGGTGTKHESPTDDPPPATTAPVDSAVPSAPDCSSVQLGQGSSSADAPDANGRVYGWFRVANVSGIPCTVPGSGQVQVLAEGAADPSRIQVVSHTPGDPAAGLPTAAGGPVVLAPGDSYEVQFAWVPASDGPGGCPTTPTTPPTTPTPTDTPTEPAATGGSTGSSPDTSDGNGASPQLGTGDAPTSPPPGSVELNHTPAAGAPVVDGPVIQNACAGTIYTTSAIPDNASGTGTSGGVDSDSGSTGSGS